MPPTLTEQQKTAIQAYTPEQRAKYNQYRSGGFSAVEAINILSESGATATPKQTLPAKIGERLKTGVERTLTDFSTPTEAIKSVSQFRPLVRGAGAAGGIVGDVIAEGLVRVTPDVVKETLTPVAETIAQAPITQKIAKILGTANESSDFILGDVANALNLVGIGALPRPVVRTVLRTGITEGVEQGIARGTRSLADFVKKVEVKTPEITPSTVVENIRETITSPTATEAIESATKAGVENLDDSIIRGAISRGLSQEDAVLLGRLTAEDKAAASKLVDAAENAAIDTAAPTVTDVIARDLITPVKSLLQKNNEFGRAVDKAAKELVGKKTDVDKIRTQIDEVLSKYGVSQGSKGLEFTSGKLRFAPPALKKEIQTLITEASKDLIKNDAYQLHTLKQAIDGAAFGGASKTAAEKAANNILKGMRRAIDNQLDADFPAYKAANEDSAYLMGFMKEMQNVFGKGKQLTEARAAAQLKSLTGTAAKRGDVENFLKLVDEAAKKYGLEGAGNLRQKADLARLLTRVYGTPASVDIAQAGKAAVSGVTAVARGIRNPIEGVGQVVAKGIEKLAGQTPQAQRDFLRKTLKQDDVVETPKVEAPGPKVEALGNKILADIDAGKYKNKSLWSVVVSVGKKEKLSESQLDDLGEFIGNNSDYGPEDIITAKVVANVSTSLAEARKYKSAEEFVKAQGKPMYHGSPAKFERFSTKNMGIRDSGSGGMLGDGIYITAVKGKNGGAKMYGDNVMEVFADIKNPFVMNDPYAFGGIDPSKIRKALDLPTNSTSKQVQEELIKRGHDGVQLNRVYDTYKNGMPTGTKLQKNVEVVVFRPEQIKTKSQLTEIWKNANKKKTAKGPGLTGKDFWETKNKSKEMTLEMNEIADIANKILNDVESGTATLDKVVAKAIKDNYMSRADIEELKAFIEISQQP